MEEVADQELQILRELMRKVIVIKNSYLDYLCTSSSILDTSGKRLKVEGEDIDFVVVRQDLFEDH